MSGGIVTFNDNITGPVSPGTAASNSALIGGQYNTSLPTLTNTQQSAVQLDSSARLIISPLTNSSIVKAQLQDNSGTAITLGQKTMSSSIPVVVASDQTGIPVKISDATGNNVTLGQKAMASSLPVVIASDQSAIPASQSGTWTVQPGNTANTTPWLSTINQGGNSATVTASNALKTDSSATTQPISAASLPLPTGASTSALQTTGNTSLASIDAGIPAALGQTTMANSMPVVLASDQSGMNTNLDKSGTGTISALNGAVTITTNGAGSAQVNVSGTWAATMIIEGVVGSTWITISGDVDSTDTVINTFTVNSLVTINCGGFPQIRIRASAYTSGTATVDWNVGSGIALVQVFNGNGSRLITDGSGVTQPVSGTVAATQSGSWIVSEITNSFSNLTGNGTTTVKSGSGVLHTVMINNNTTGGTITIYDNTAGSGTKIATMTVGSPSGGLLSTSGQPGPFSSSNIDIAFSTGLTVVRAGSASNDITVIYR